MHPNPSPPDLLRQLETHFPTTAPALSDEVGPLASLDYKGILQLIHEIYGLDLAIVDLQADLAAAMNSNAASTGQLPTDADADADQGMPGFDCQKHRTLLNQARAGRDQKAAILELSLVQMRILEHRWKRFSEAQPVTSINHRFTAPIATPGDELYAVLSGSGLAEPVTASIPNPYVGHPFARYSDGGMIGLD
jgi:hypothetical protein